MCGCHTHAHTPQQNGFLKEKKKDLIPIDNMFLLSDFQGKSNYGYPKRNEHPI